MFPFFAIFLLLTSPAEEAERLMDEADAALSAGNPLAALNALKAAYKLDPNPRYIANQGLVLEQLGEVGRAVEKFERYLEMETSPDKRELATLNIDRLKPKILFDSTPNGAQVFIDGAATPACETPCHAKVLAGDHFAELKKPDHEVARLTFTVEKGHSSVVKGTLVPSSWSLSDLLEPNRVVGWTLIGISAASALVSVVAFYQMSDEMDARDGAGDLDAWDDHDEAARGWSTGGWIGLGLSLASAAGAALLMPSTDPPDQAGWVLIRF